MYQKRFYSGTGYTDALLSYDSGGKLVRAGNTSFAYDSKGSLREKLDERETFYFSYGKDTMLGKVVLPTGEVVRYAYNPANPTAPVRKYRNGHVAVEYTWSDSLRLALCRDHDDGLEYTFMYDAQSRLHRLRITPFRPVEEQNPYRDWAADSLSWLNDFAAKGRRDRLDALFARQGGELDLLCCCDHVGTLKVLTDVFGQPIKEIVYHSFGVPFHDTLPDLCIPIGFAGGLVDRDTRLVRFGYRDYDPEVGRFTARDPLGDTGGDHDVYDYCIDDPINLVDRNGLNPWRRCCSARRYWGARPWNL